MNELLVVFTIVLKIELLLPLQLNYSEFQSDKGSEIFRFIDLALCIELIAIAKRLTPLKIRFC